MESQIVCRLALMKVSVLPNASDFCRLHPTRILRAHQASWRTCGVYVFQFAVLLVFIIIYTDQRLSLHIDPMWEAVRPLNPNLKEQTILSYCEPAAHLATATVEKQPRSAREVVHTCQI